MWWKQLFWQNKVFISGFYNSTEFKQYLDKTIMLQRWLTGSAHPQCEVENVACKPPSEAEVIFSSCLKCSH